MTHCAGCSVSPAGRVAGQHERGEFAIHLRVDRRKAVGRQSQALRVPRIDQFRARRWTRVRDLSWRHSGWADGRDRGEALHSARQGERAGLSVVIDESRLQPCCGVSPYPNHSAWGRRRLATPAPFAARWTDALTWRAIASVSTPAVSGAIGVQPTALQGRWLKKGFRS